MSHDLVTIDHTFADEWGENDLILTPSEVQTVRNIAEKFGLPISHHPTGRTVELVLMHLQGIALQKMSEGDRRYKTPFIAARRAMGKANLS